MINLYFQDYFIKKAKNSEVELIRGRKHVSMEKGILYWITGLSGAGKTTIGNRLYYRMKPQKNNTIILDGDILKKIAGKDLAYNKEDRLERAYRYSALCKLLTDQGINVIICTIAMFDEVRDWNRSYIEKYVEIFLDVDMEVLKARNRKGLYSQKGGNIAGIDVEVEYPKQPDIVIKNNDKQSLDESIQEILKYKIKPKDRWNHDDKYWDNYYTENISKINAAPQPSLFARDMYLKYMEAGKDIIELGCGNGRDSLYFVQKGLNVTGIDASQVAISKLQENCSMHNCVFICDDFVNAESIYQIQYDYCYSRFTLHAINEQQEVLVLRKAYDMLKKDGYFFIEARSIHDGKCGMGQRVEKNAYIFDGHYRRFIDLTELVSKLKCLGFSIVEQVESDKFAPQKGEDAVCVRVVAQKMEIV